MNKTGDTDMSLTISTDGPEGMAAKSVQACQKRASHRRSLYTRRTVCDVLPVERTYGGGQ